MRSSVVTFLFTDLEDSRRLREDHSRSMRVMLARHDVLLRDAIVGVDLAQDEIRTAQRLLAHAGRSAVG